MIFLRWFFALLSLVLAMPVCSDSPGSWKYQDFIFEPHYGSGVQYGYKVFYQGAPFYKREYDSVAELVRLRYGYEKEVVTRTGVNNKFPYTAEKGFIMGGYVEVVNGVFVFRGLVEINSVKGALSCNDKRECPKSGFWAVADTNSDTLQMLDYPSDVVEKQGRYQNPVRAYGCYNDNPIHSGDINGDGEPEILLFSGYGKGQTDIEDAYLGEDEASYDLRGGFDLLIYSGADYTTSLLELNMLDADYVLGSNEARLTGADSRKPRFHFYNVEKIKSGAPIEDWGAGYQIPAKLYVADIDENNHMDVLVWHRKYISKPISDPVIGFVFDSEDFERYEEGDDGKFIPVGITKEDAKKVIVKHQWSWEAGFPNKDFCDYSPSYPDDDPSLLYIHNEYGIGKVTQN